MGDVLPFDQERARVVPNVKLGNVTLNGMPWLQNAQPLYVAATWNDRYLCPDQLAYRDIGAADNMRGRVVRAFFWLMRAWPARGDT